MKVGIMQPYFLPYIGYWQLVNAVDKYVIYDDVNFIKGGWIYRNRILLADQPKYLNIQMIGASSNKLINKIGVINEKKVINKNLKMIQHAYAKAPFYCNIYPLIKDILSCGEEHLITYITYSLKKICDYIGITTELILSSDIKKEESLKGQDRVLSICHLLNATSYFNAIGGKELYSFEEFKQQGIDLCFLQSNKISYQQFANDFQPNLSILDVMMFNSVDQIKLFLQEYTLVDSKSGEKQFER